MPSVSLESRNGLVCTRCGRRAAFLAPIGPLCPTDALLAAAFHDWIPTQIRDSRHDDEAGEARRDV